MGTVVLSVTGAEALYADMGHFGSKPIRQAWFGFVLPSLILNYFGQGALLLVNLAAADNPFYRLSAEWLFYPLVALATLATVIASQAVISGAFSVSRQAMQLGFLPRIEVQFTSEKAQAGLSARRQLGSLYRGGHSCARFPDNRQCRCGLWYCGDRRHGHYISSCNLCCGHKLGMGALDCILCRFPFA
jgi:hypothetical protein